MEYNTFTQKNYKLKTYKERLDLKKKKWITYSTIYK
jgi:stress response protein YsnF